MTTKSSSIAVATSDISGRLKNAVKAAEIITDPARMHRLKEVKKRIDKLSEKGLLKRQKYSSLSTADFEKRYIVTSKANHDIF